MRGLQRGAASFGSSTASAALELSNRLVQAIQVSGARLCGAQGSAPSSEEQSRAGRSRVPGWAPAGGVSPALRPPAGG